MISSNLRAGKGSPEVVIGNVARTLTKDLVGIEPPAPDKPRTLFPSELELTREQEDALVLHAQRGVERLDGELGRSESMLSNGLPLFMSHESRTAADRDTVAKKFMAKRAVYELVAKNDVTWRKTMLPQSIFANSNLTIPLSRRIAKQSAARAVNYFFGTDPWVALHAIGAEDLELSKKLQRLLDIKMIESGSQAVLKRGVSRAFDFGESVMKVTHVRKTKRFREWKEVALDGEGKPLLAQDGETIAPDELWTLNSAGVEVLKRDGLTQKPAGLVFGQSLIDQEIVIYEGPEISKIYFRDFMAPEGAKDLQSAEIVVHFMERTASEMAADYLQSGQHDLRSLQNAAALLQNALTDTHASKTGEQGARGDDGQDNTPERAEPVTEYAEIYLHYDADGDGVIEDIMLLMDPKTGTPIYYNYVANLTDNHLRPFFAITPKPVENRWYGQGIYEEFESHQSSVDLVYNRRNFSQSAAGRVTFWDPSATVEGQTDPKLKLNGGKTYRLKPGKLMEDALKVFYLDDNKFERLTEEIDFIMQIAMNESGVQHANDAQTAGLETAKLATGVRNIEKSGQELFALPISEIETCLTPICEAFNTTLFANISDEETFFYFQDETPVELTLAKRDIAHLKFNIQVLLTRFREEQVMQSTTQAIVLIREYYSYPPEVQIIMAPLYRELLKALQIQKADNYIQPGVAMMGAPTGPAGAPTGQHSASKVPPANL